MNPRTPIPAQLLETLSAYLDGKLEAPEKTALEARLRKEEGLRRELEELRSVRDSLRRLPVLKPPRSLALTPALVGEASQKKAVFTPRRMAFGSALASLGFVILLAAVLLSRGSSMLATRAPQSLAANEAFAAPAESAVEDGVGKSGGGQPTGTVESLQAPLPNATRMDRGCEGCTLTVSEPTLATSPTTAPGGGCGGCTPTEGTAANPPGATGRNVEATPQPRRAPDFQTVVPFLEAFLGVAAVLLAAAALAAVLVRRRR
jgi:hypothetical protein